MNVFLLNAVKCFIVLGFVFFVSCQGGKSVDSETDNADRGQEQSEEPSEDSEESQEQLIDEYAEDAKLIDPESAEPKSKELQVASNPNSPCNASSYMEYVLDFSKVALLKAETGAGCYLPGVDFSNKDLTNFVLTGADLRGAVFKGAVLEGTKFIKADLTNAVLEDTDYMTAYFREAVLTGVKYNEYDAITAWMKVLTGQGIRDPKSRGMVYTGSKEE